MPTFREGKPVLAAHGLDGYEVEFRFPLRYFRQAQTAGEGLRARMVAAGEASAELCNHVEAFRAGMGTNDAGPINLDVVRQEGFDRLFSISNCPNCDFALLVLPDLEQASVTIRPKATRTLN